MTPAASSYGSSQNGICGDKPSAGTPSLETWAKTWPTPTVARNYTEEIDGKRGQGLYGVAGTWSGPSGSRETGPETVADPDSKDPEFWAKAPFRGDGKTFWPTPLASDSEQRGAFGRGNETLSSEASRNWATPTARDGKGERGEKGLFAPQLPDQAGLWPTPTANEATGYMSGTRSDTWRPSLKSRALERQSHGHRAPTTEKGGDDTSKPYRVLNPRFVEALMGWPIGWTSLGRSETGSSRRPPSKPSGSSP
jgi:DNA (cytosine-5)-methyltransferase 1